MAYTLGQAAKATGKSKPTILYALRNGKISGSQNEQRRWQIEPAELHRVYPPITVSKEVELNDTEPQKQSSANAYLLAVQAERDGLKALVGEIRKERDELSRRLDEETGERRKLTLLLTDQRHPKSWLERIGFRRSS